MAKKWQFYQTSDLKKRKKKQLQEMSEPKNDYKTDGFKMRHYIARVLVEHKIIPEPENYSSFSELIILGKYHLPKNLEFSQLLFDEQIDILTHILSIISEKVNDEYKNANNETVCIKVKEITKIEDTKLSLPVACDIYEIDEKLYTFEKSMTFHEFRKIYNLGSYLR